MADEPAPAPAPSPKPSTAPPPPPPPFEPDHTPIGYSKKGLDDPPNTERR